MKRRMVLTTGVLGRIKARGRQGWGHFDLHFPDGRVGQAHMADGVIVSAWSVGPNGDDYRQWPEPGSSNE